MISGMGGFEYSVVNNTFTHADTTPDQWSFMEWYMPIRAANMTKTEWIHTRVNRQEAEDGFVYKTIEIENDFFESVNLQPWTEDAVVVKEHDSS